MADRSSGEQIPGPRVIADRYRLQEVLGRGGMAVVVRALDVATGRELALKRLLPRKDDDKHKDMAGLFEYEFHALAQLAHPRVIEVYDYGKDDTGPYYTMELLDGGDLRELSPVPWKQACSLLADVCSALSLLHSRRQVHRDLTTRNVRCTRDAKAKLIDFGAMMPMGPSKQVIGTPAFAAPEAVALQALDARTDLYALGATLYYALTRRHAYPAKSFDELRDVWRSKPLAPSSYVEDIPVELDNLVLSLLSLDRVARPTNAAEVMERLSVIGGFEVDDRLLVSQAYLTTPTLVGRDEPLLRVRKRMIRALRGSGSSLVIEGGSGAGRSRFLDACVLEGTLSGAIVLRADASDAHTGHWGAVRAMISQLLEASPAVAWEAAKPHLPVLGHVFPELLGRCEAGTLRLSMRPAERQRWPFSEHGNSGYDASAEVWARGTSQRPPPAQTPAHIQLETFDSPKEVRPRVQAALRDWLLNVSGQQCLMLAVDDVHRMDEPSAAFVAMLAHELYQQMLVIAVTQETGAAATAPVALKLFREAARTLALENLSSEHTRQLLCSIFGDAPNVGLVADRIQAISQGSPRAVMQLTQHLVDKGLVRYQAGAWTLPGHIDAGDLPNSLTEALKAQVQKLEPPALNLAQSMALSPEHSFSFEECCLVAGHQDTAQLIRALDELVACGMLSTDGDRYTFRQQGWVSVLTEAFDPDEKRAAHLRLAQLYERGKINHLRRVQHLLNGGEEERALDLWIGHLEEIRADATRDPKYYSEYMQSLPRDWVQTIERLLDICERRNRPRKDAYVVRRSLAVFSAVSLTADKVHMAKVIERLVCDSGLQAYHELGDSVPAEERLGRALQLAQERYDACPESERVLPPADAIRQLAEHIVGAISLIGSSYDYDVAASLPSLEPLAPLSAALGVVQMNVQSTACIIGARYEQARQGYLEILERLAQPDRCGLDASTHHHMRLAILHGVGMIEAGSGFESALDRAAELVGDPRFQVNAWKIRAVYYLRRGDAQKAEECKKQAELLQIQHSPSQFFEGSHLLPEITAHACSDDLVRVNQVIDDIQRMAERFPGWAPILHFARGEYQRIRGDYKSALLEMEKALNLTGPGRNPIWPYLAGTYVHALLAVGRIQEGRRVGEELVAEAEKADLRVYRHFATRALALAEAKTGEHEQAVKRAQSAIDEYREKGVVGLVLGLAHETRARVAICMNDVKSFETYAQLCAAQFRAGNNPVLTAKYEKLMQEARQANLGVSTELANAAEFTQMTAETAIASVGKAMRECRGAEQRAQCALKMLIRQGNCQSGFLYTVQKEGTLLSARVGEQAPAAEVETIVKRHLLAEIDGAGDTTMTGTDHEAFAGLTYQWTDQREEGYRAVLLGHEAPEGFVVTGLAVLVPEPGKLFSFPGKMAAAVSQALLTAGDVAKVYAAG